MNSASPLQLVIMLYDGALRFIKKGQAAMIAGDRYNQNYHLVKAQKIVAELMSCLDMDQGQEVAANLLALYTFAYNQLVMANMEDQPEPLMHASKVLEDLRESWVELERMARTGGTAEHVIPKAA